MPVQGVSGTITWSQRMMNVDLMIPNSANFQCPNGNWGMYIGSKWNDTTMNMQVSTSGSHLKTKRFKTLKTSFIVRLW